MGWIVAILAAGYLTLFSILKAAGDADRKTEWMMEQYRKEQNK